MGLEEQNLCAYAALHLVRVSWSYWGLWEIQQLPQQVSNDLGGELSKVRT